jgi:hypothetical protein
MLSIVHAVNWNSPKYLLSDADFFIGAMMCFYLLVVLFNIVFLGDSGVFDRTLFLKYWKRLLIVAVLAALLLGSAYSIGGRFVHRSNDSLPSIHAVP